MFNPKQIFEGLDSQDELYRLVSDLPSVVKNINKATKTLPIEKLEDSLPQFILDYSGNWSCRLDLYRKEIRDFLRQFVFLSERGFVESRGEAYRPASIDQMRFIYVVGIAPHGNYYFEKSRMLIPVKDWSMVGQIDGFLESRVRERGRAIIPSDLIYSRHVSEKYDTKGYLIDPDNNNIHLKYIQVAEGVMFRKKVSDEERGSIEDRIVGQLCINMDLGNGKKSRTNSFRSKVKKELEYFLQVPETYDSLFEAFFQTIAYTVTIGDLFDRERIKQLANQKSALAERLQQNILSVAEEIEDIIFKQGKERDLIDSPYGVVLFGYKTQSLSHKLILAGNPIRKGKETDIANRYLQSKGLSKNSEFSRRYLHDVARATFIAWGSYFSPDKTRSPGVVPLQDSTAEIASYKLFLSHHDLPTGELERIKQGHIPSSTPTISSRGLYCNWNDPRAYENYLHRRKPNGFGSFNTTVNFNHGLGISTGEFVYRPQVDDRNSLFGDRDHSQYKLQPQALVEWLVQQKKVATERELIIIQALFSPGHRYVHF